MTLLEAAKKVRDLWLRNGRDAFLDGFSEPWLSAYRSMIDAVEAEEKNAFGPSLGRIIFSPIVRTQTWAAYCSTCKDGLREETIVGDAQRFVEMHNKMHAVLKKEEGLDEQQRRLGIRHPRYVTGSWSEDWD